MRKYALSDAAEAGPGETRSCAAEREMRRGDMVRRSIDPPRLFPKYSGKLKSLAASTVTGQVMVAVLSPASWAASSKVVVFKRFTDQ